MRAVLSSRVQYHVQIVKPNIKTIGSFYNLHPILVSKKRPLIWSSFSEWLGDRGSNNFWKRERDLIDGGHLKSDMSTGLYLNKTLVTK